MSGTTGSGALAACLQTVARDIFGEPTSTHGDEIRFRTQGSLSVHKTKGFNDHEANVKGGTLAFLLLYKQLDKAAALAWLVEHKHIDPPTAPNASKPMSKVVATYDYVDQANKLIFQVCRMQPKKFLQRRPGEDGNWIWNMQNVQRVIYRLPQVIAAIAAGEVIYVVEGEKSADWLVKLGLTATCSSGGANKWKAAYQPFFAGADVVILPDEDEPGCTHGLSVARALFGVAARVRILTLPGLPVGGDVVNWLEAGGTVEALAQLAKAAPDTNGAERLVGREAQWLRQCQKNDDGDPISNLANAMLALREDHCLANAFGYDEMERAAFVVGRLPGDKPGVLHVTRAIRDVDVSQVQEYLQLAGLRGLSQAITHQAVDQRADECAFHPARDWMNGLVWDGVERLPTWLTTYLGVADTPYSSGVGLMFFVSMIARIFRPGCKADHMMVLEGPQGALKSTACAVIGGPYYSDSLPDLKFGGKDVAQHINGKMLIEMGELSATDKAEAVIIKAVLSRCVERYRPSYGRKEVVEPRQCVFIGTTNKSNYLRDETGGRRTWPVVVGTIDIDALRRDRDQLFAEAVQAFKRGVQWWPDRQFERLHIKQEQEARYEGDAWQQPVVAWLDGRNPLTNSSETAPRNNVTILDVARGALFIETPRLGTADQRRIAAILIHINWVQGKRTMSARPWIRPKKA